MDLASSSTFFVLSIETHHFVDVLLDQLHSPGLCDHPPGLLRVEPHTLGHIVPEGRVSNEHPQWNNEPYTPSGILAVVQKL